MSGCTANDRCEADGWVCSCVCGDAGAGGSGDGGTTEDDGSDAGSDGGTDAGTDGGLTPTGICLDIAQRKCDFEVRCRTDLADNQGRTNGQIAASQKAGCVASEASDPGCLVAAEGWEQGRASLNKTAYLACIDSAYPAQTCARDLNIVFASCDPKQYIVPATAPGGLCTSDTECSSGYCTVNSAPACGLCMGYSAVTQPCTRDAMCNPATSYCPMADGTSGSCTTYLAQGDTCTRRLDLRAQDEVCGPGRICKASVALSATGTCEIGLAEDQPCVKGAWQCQRSARSAVPALVCATIAGTNKCVKVANTAAGGQCNSGESVLIFQTPVCLESEFCSSGLCFPRKALSAQCAAGQDQCQSGMHCVGVGTNAHCEAYKDLSASCGSANECKNLLNCQAAQCVPDHALVGEVCSSAVKCSEGFCDTAAVPNRCTALKGVGALCSGDNQCQSFECSVGGMESRCVKGCWQ